MTIKELKLKNKKGLNIVNDFRKREVGTYDSQRIGM